MECSCLRTFTAPTLLTILLSACSSDDTNEPPNPAAGGAHPSGIAGAAGGGTRVGEAGSTWVVAGAAGSLSSGGSTDAGAGASGLVAGAPGVAGASAALPRSAESVLNDLGISTTAEQKYQNAQNLEFKPSSSWQPMRKPATVFFPSSEVFVAGTAYPNTSAAYNVLFDHLPLGANNPTTLATPFTTDDGRIKARTKASIAADIDGDGIQEIVLFTLGGIPTTDDVDDSVDTNQGSPREIDFYVYHNGGDAPGSSTSFGPVVVEGLTYPRTADKVVVSNGGVDGHVWAPHFSLSKGDIDGDGTDEIFLTVFDKVHIFNLPSSRVGSLKRVGTLTYAKPVSSVATGDVDGDNRDEFIVCGRNTDCSLYDGFTPGAPNNPIWRSPTPSALPLMVAATFGDFNGDGVDEFAIARATQPSGCTGTATADIYRATAQSIDPSTGRAVNVRVEDLPLVSGLLTSNQLGCDNGGTYDAWRLLLTGIDLDGDGKDELFMHNTFFLNVLSEKTRATLNLSASICDSPAGTETILDARVGVVDQDKIEYALLNPTDARPRENLVVLSLAQPGYDLLKMQAFGLKASTANELESIATYLNVSNNLGDPTASFTRGYTNYSLAVGNVDNDTPRMIATGHELTYSDPFVVAVLSSPPYWQSVAAVDETYESSYPAWSTTLTSSTSSSTDTSTSIGATVGFGIAYEQEASFFGIKIAQFKTSAEFETTASVEWAKSREVSQSVTFSATGGEDRVIFAATPLDKYSYRILYSPSASEIGKTITLSIPRALSKYSVPLAAFRAATGLDITTSHTLGEPFSYPTLSEETILKSSFPGFLSSTEAQAVSMGGTAPSPGINGLGISISDTSGTSFSVDASAQFSVEAGGGGVTAMAKLGFNTGYSYGYATTNETSFTGTVGYLPDAYYNDGLHFYKSKLIAYPYPDPKLGRTYWIVDYAVTPN